MTKKKNLSDVATRRVLQDLVIPTLSNPEQACLQYMLRHFKDITRNGNPTKTTPITRKQLETGSQASQYVFDLGVGLSAATIRDAVEGLVSKGLVKEESFCKHCFLIEDSSRSNTATRCHRCSKKLSKAYRVENATPDWIRSYLNAHYADKYSWDYDEATGQFYTLPPMATTRTVLETPPDYESVLVQARNKLWFPILVDRAVEQAQGTLKSGKISDARVLHGFYKPVLGLQEQFPRQVLGNALKVTVQKRIAAGKTNKHWYRYARAVAQNQISKQEQASAQHILSVQDVTKALEECSRLNTRGDRGTALNKLRRLLGNTETIRTHFAPPTTTSSCRNHILEAFKKGLADYRGVQRYASPHDFLPKWSWGDPVPKTLVSGKIKAEEQRQRK